MIDQTQEQQGVEMQERPSSESEASQPTESNETSKEKDNTRLEKTKELQAAFSDSLVSTGLVTSELYLHFTSPELQADNSQVVTNQERQKEIENLEKFSKDQTLTISERAQFNSSLQEALIEQAYSDFLFIKKHISDLNKKVEESQLDTATPTQKLEAELKRKTIITQLSTVFVNYGNYMESTPTLISEYLTTDENIVRGPEVIQELNDKLYLQLGLDKDNLPSQGYTINQVLHTVSLKYTENSEAMNNSIRSADNTIENYKKQIGQQSLQENSAATANGSTPEDPVNSENSQTPAEQSPQVENSVAPTGSSELDTILQGEPANQQKEVTNDKQT